MEDFGEAEYRLICLHLGHTLQVHERWYRMRDTTPEFVKVGRILTKDYENYTSVGM